MDCNDHLAGDHCSTLLLYILMRQYGRGDIDYETWYSEWMKSLAKLHTQEELEKMLGKAQNSVQKSAESHLNAIKKSTSMQSNSMARAHARNAVSADGEARIAIDGALEIYELFPEHTREAARRY